MNITFIGLGIMGFPMAGHLASAGLNVCVYNRTQSKTSSWLDRYTGTTADTPAQACENSDIVLTCVGNDNDLRNVILGECGAIHRLKQGAIIVDHTTTSAHIAAEMENILTRQGATFIDAPVSGGQQGAENGKLSIMCGGKHSAFETVQPILQHYAQKIAHMGHSGNGQLTKMVNQIAVTGLIQALAEAIQFAQHAGLNIDDVINVISKGAAQSWQMENRYQTMSDDQYEHGFAVDLMRKDLSICLEEARHNGAHLPITSLIDQFYSEIQTMGGGRWDTSSLLKRLQATKKTT